MSTVYLIHFETPFKHARHYLGYTSLALEERINRHRSNRGAKLLIAVSSAGIKWNVVRTWVGGRELETQLKRRKNAPTLCPICTGRKFQ